ncbi:MAG: hypothetical protein V1777_01935 [Candidatus Micrarchaeota archaeon]
MENSDFEFDKSINVTMVGETAMTLLDLKSPTQGADIELETKKEPTKSNTRETWKTRTAKFK